MDYKLKYLKYKKKYLNLKMIAGSRIPENIYQDGKIYKKLPKKNNSKEISKEKPNSVNDKYRKLDQKKRKNIENFLLRNIRKKCSNPKRGKDECESRNCIFIEKKCDSFVSDSCIQKKFNKISIDDVMTTNKEKVSNIYFTTYYLKDNYCNDEFILDLYFILSTGEVSFTENLMTIDRNYREIEINCVGTPLRNSGIGSWIVKTMLEKIYDDLKENYSITLNTHTGAYKYWEKIGFELDSDPKKSQGMHDIHMSSYLYSILENLR